MLMLCADTSGPTLAFSLVEQAQSGERRILNSIGYPCAGKMNESFFPLLDEFLISCTSSDIPSIKIEDVDRWISITGPGSFTGIRIGIAALSGITTALNRPHLGISALDAAALSTRLPVVKVAARLKLSEYAVRDYNFTTGSHSEIYVEHGFQPQAGTVIVNSGENNTPGLGLLTEAVAAFQADGFFMAAEAVYVRRSEAEINFDKKGVKN